MIGTVAKMPAPFPPADLTQAGSSAMPSPPRNGVAAPAPNCVLIWALMLQPPIRLGPP